MTVLLIMGASAPVPGSALAHELNVVIRRNNGGSISISRMSGEGCCPIDPPIPLLFLLLLLLNKESESFLSCIFIF